LRIVPSIRCRSVARPGDPAVSGYIKDDGPRMSAATQATSEVTFAPFGALGMASLMRPA
jgi:hypothetical protein